MKNDRFSEEYRAWCVKNEIETGTEAIKRFHKEKRNYKHMQCNYCEDGAMNR